MLRCVRRPNVSKRYATLVRTKRLSAAALLGTLANGPATMTGPRRVANVYAVKIFLPTLPFTITWLGLPYLTQYIELLEAQNDLVQ